MGTASLGCSGSAAPRGRAAVCVALRGPVDLDARDIRGLEGVEARGALDTALPVVAPAGLGGDTVHAADVLAVDPPLEIAIRLIRPQTMHDKVMPSVDVEHPRLREPRWSPSISIRSVPLEFEFTNNPASTEPVD
jgi:hypothetical protein